MSMMITDVDNTERKKVNVFEMKCLGSLVGVSRMNRVRNEEVRRRAGIGRELEQIRERVEQIREY